LEDIEKFIGGFSRFQQQYFNDSQTLFDSLRAGQRPGTLLIGCCDRGSTPCC
jgi:carbonic anhydrase